MPLSPGVRFGPYEILRPLGSGGVGEVYRARDTRLGRDVAIKILSAELSADFARRQRFEREAKIISSLNHPHICVLYDVGHQDSLDYLVMECVEGESLAARLQKGPMSLEQVLKYGAQIAEALDKAHRAGIVHRDLKPGNIMLTATGAKLLDFGLAKPVLGAASLTTLTTASAMSSPLTHEGTVVGTFPYMSPEQVEGKELDGRSDIFSLGAALYEMVTGKRAFEGESQLSVASAILEKEPAPINNIKPHLPPALDHAVRRSLAKNPDERWQSASDLKSELNWIRESGSQAGVPVSVTGRESWKGVAWTAVAAALGVIALMAGYPRLRSILKRGTGSAVAGIASFHEKEERYIFVASATRLPYWQDAEAGFKDAAKQMGVKVELMGPTVYAPDEELAAFQQAVSQKPSGILLTASSAELFRSPINSAIEQGIPVICMDADSPESKRILFIGTDNFRAGQESGRRMRDLLKGKGNIVVVTVVGQLNLDDRVRGVEETLKKFPAMKLTRTTDDRSDPRKAYDAVSALMHGKDKPDGIICLEASGGAGSAEALHGLDLTGKVPIVAFDKDPETLDWIQRGAIAATVVQKPYVMSYFGLKFLDELHHNAVHEFGDSKTASDSWTWGPPRLPWTRWPPMPVWVDTGTEFVDKNNLAAFREALAARPKP